MYRTILALAALAIESAAFPGIAAKLAERDDRAWIAPTSDAVRSPCPGTNTLANHGFINRNGKGITREAFQQGFLDAFGLSFPVTAAGARNALNLQCPGCTKFNLDTLNRPHAIEHDGSLSRLDARMMDNPHANNHDFNQSVWDSTLDIYGCNSHIDVSLLNTARLGRFKQAKAHDAPGWFQENPGGSLAEAGFTLSTMNDPSVGGTLDAPKARLKWIDYWFRNERLPTEIGWIKPKQPVPNDAFEKIRSMVKAAPMATPAPRGPGCSVDMASSTSKPHIKAASVAQDPTDSTQSSPPAAVTSAVARATRMAGKRPDPVNGYAQVLPWWQWSDMAMRQNQYFRRAQCLTAAMLRANGGGRRWGQFGAPAWFGFGVGGAEAGAGTVRQCLSN